MSGPPTAILEHEVDSEKESCMIIGEAEIYKDRSWTSQPIELLKINFYFL